MKIFTYANDINLLFKHEYLDEKLLIPDDRKKIEMKRED
jgi:hypothetical protein